MLFQIETCYQLAQPSPVPASLPLPCPNKHLPKNPKVTINNSQRTTLNPKAAFAVPTADFSLLNEDVPRPSKVVGKALVSTPAFWAEDSAEETSERREEM